MQNPQISKICVFEKKLNDIMHYPLKEKGLKHKPTKVEYLSLFKY